MTEDIHILLGKYFSGEATAEEQEAVRQWAVSSEENQSEFRLMQELWKVSGQENPVPFNTANAWAKVDQRLRSPQKTGRTVGMFRLAVGVAASLILVIGLWWMLGRTNDSMTVTATAAVQEILLEDGSKIYLRKGATLTYPESFDNGKRQVELKGEAFFEVKHDPSKPFLVVAEEAEVRVLGTSFTVNTHGEQVELIVKTGKVSFAPLENKAGALVVTAGEKALLDGGQVHKAPNSDPNFNAWQSRKLIFENTPLSQVIETLNDYYQVRIILKKEDSLQLSQAKVSTIFSDQDLASVLKELSLITSYHIEKRNETDYEISIK